MAIILYFSFFVSSCFVCACASNSETIIISMGCEFNIDNAINLALPFIFVYYYELKGCIFEEYRIDPHRHSDCLVIKWCSRNLWTVNMMIVCWFAIGNLIYFFFLHDFFPIFSALSAMCMYVYFLERRTAMNVTPMGGIPFDAEQEQFHFLVRFFSVSVVVVGIFVFRLILFFFLENCLFVSYRKENFSLDNPKKRRAKI